MDHRLNLLALFIQDPNVHRYLIPGRNWLLCSHSSKTVDGAVSLADAIGVPEEEFKKLYGERWAGKVDKAEYPFNFFRTRKFSSRNYITPKPHDDYSDHGSDMSIAPDRSTILFQAKHLSFERQPLPRKRPLLLSSHHLLLSKLQSLLLYPRYLVLPLALLQPPHERRLPPPKLYTLNLLLLQQQLHLLLLLSHPIIHVKLPRLLRS